MLRVPGSVALNFRSPKSSIYAGDVPALWTAVPKAAIHENGKALLREKEIRLSKNIFRMKRPTPDACPYYSKPEPALCGFVSLASDGRHRARPNRGDSLKFACWQLSAQRLFHLSNALVAICCHRRCEPKELVLAEVVAHSRLPTVS
jgi:hypothetical protein